MIIVGQAFLPARVFGRQAGMEPLGSALRMSSDFAFRISGVIH